MRFGRKPKSEEEARMVKGTIDTATVKAQAMVLVQDLRSSLDRLEDVLDGMPPEKVDGPLE